MGASTQHTGGRAPHTPRPRQECPPANPVFSHSSSPLFCPPFCSSPLPTEEGGAGARHPRHDPTRPDTSEHVSSAPESVEQLLALLQQVTELVDDLPLLVVHLRHAEEGRAPGSPPPAALTHTHTHQPLGAPREVSAHHIFRRGISVSVSSFLFLVYMYGYLTFILSQVFFVMSVFLFSGRHFGSGPSFLPHVYIFRPIQVFLVFLTSCFLCFLF